MFGIIRAFLKRQHRIKLLERNKIVQEELEEDRRVLEELRSLQAEEEAQQEAKDKQSRSQQLEWLKNVSNTLSIEKVDLISDEILEKLILVLLLDKEMQYRFMLSGFNKSKS